MVFVLVAKLQNNADVTKRFWKINAVHPKNEGNSRQFEPFFTFVLVMGRITINGKQGLLLHINQTPIVQWFKEQLGIGQKHLLGIRR